MMREAPVVVGFDASAADADAVEWATAEAAARGCPLTVVHAVRSTLPVDPYGLLSISDIDDILAASGRAALGEAARRARSVAPAVELSCRQVVGTPVRVLIEESRRARLLVLGGRSSGDGPHHDGARRATHRILAGSACPVVIVRRGGLASHDGAAPRVVLDLDGEGDLAPMIGFALASARQRGIPVTALTVMPLRPRPRTRQDGDLALDELRAGYADVPVVRRFLPVEDPDALVAQTAGAAMVVVGQRRRRRMPGADLDAVGVAALWHARCPVAVIGHSGWSRPGSRRWSAWKSLGSALERLRDARHDWHVTWL